MKKYYENCPISVTPRDFSASEISSFSGVSMRTARRYRRENRAPEPVMAILHYAAAGWLLPQRLKQFVRWSGANLLLDGTGELDIDELRAWWIDSQVLYSELYSLRGRVDRLQRLEVIRGTSGPLRLLEKPAKEYDDNAGQQQPKDQGAYGVGRRGVAYGLQGVSLGVGYDDAATNAKP